MKPIRDNIMKLDQVYTKIKKIANGESFDIPFNMEYILWIAVNNQVKDIINISLKDHYETN